MTGRTEDSIDWPSRLSQALQRARAFAEDDPAAWERAAQLAVVARTLGDDHAAFLAWARDDPAWRLVVAECATRVCAKPREAAAFILIEGLRELLEDEGVLPPTSG